MNKIRKFLDKGFYGCKIFKLYAAYISAVKKTSSLSERLAV
jgi:hypothetical protein